MKTTPSHLYLTSAIPKNEAIEITMDPISASPTGKHSSHKNSTKTGIEALKAKPQTIELIKTKINYPDFRTNINPPNTETFNNIHINRIDLNFKVFPAKPPIIKLPNTPATILEGIKIDTSS